MSDITGERSKRVTITDVARQAGVSVPTVSKVLNNRDDVAAHTRDEVNAVIASTGYHARRYRQGAPTGRVPIEVVFRDLTGPYVAEILAGALVGTTRAGFELVVSTAGDHAGSPDRGNRRSGQLLDPWLAGLRARRPRGIVLVADPRFSGHTATAVATLRVPVVLLDAAGGGHPLLPTVGATNFAGGKAATEHLLDLGHRRIAIITGPPALTGSQERLEGFHAAMNRYGAPIEGALMQHQDFSAEGGQRAAAALLGLEDPPTAIFAGSDVMASGVLQEAHLRGTRIPDDLSVIGFDDVSMCQYMSPPLTTVHQPLSEMASEAVRILAGAIAEEVASGTSKTRLNANRALTQLQLATRLVTRGSTAPPRTGL